MKKKLYSYTIMPLDIDHLDEICQHIKEQYENGVASCALFSMTLVSEGNPVTDKASLFCKRYEKFQAKLNLMALKFGALAQTLVGYDWVLGEMFPYQTHVNFNDGVATRVVCPCDENYKNTYKMQ